MISLSKFTGIGRTTISVPSLRRKGGSEAVATSLADAKDEVEGGTLALKSRKGGDLGSFSVDEAVAMMAAAQRTYLEPHEVPAAAGASAEAA